MKNDEFDDIRPFYDEEIPEAMRRIVADPLFDVIAPRIYPDKSLEQVRQIFLSVNNIWEFQDRVARDIILRIASQSSSGTEIRGFEQLDPKQSYLFVSNHRDIMLDSALTNLWLYDLGFQCFEITFGSNLMTLPLAVDFGRANRMFRVERGKTFREFLTHSKHLSQYIRYTITEKKRSVWIAQRNGRTKDGNDVTDPGLIKMFAISGNQTTLSERIRDLNIVPVAISYEYEPCDRLKVNELYRASRQKYQKSEDEDMNSIATGVVQAKGHIVIDICTPLNSLLGIGELSSATIATLIDTQIHDNYHLFPTNFIAYDILNKTSEHLNRHYSPTDREQFIAYMNTQLAGLDGEIQELVARFLRVYAYPVSNKSTTSARL